MSILECCLAGSALKIEGAPKDYRDFAAQLEQINELLEQTGA